MKYWVCAFSPAYAPQAKVLEDSVRKYTEHLFTPVHITGEIKAGALARLTVTRDLLIDGAKEVIISGADYYLRNQLSLSPLGSALLCPHAFRLPYKKSEAVNAMRAGVANSDFQVWRPKALGFLCEMIYQIEQQELFQNVFEYEQMWLPYVLTCANGRMIQDQRIGAAYYNLHEREIDQDTIAIHFSGWSVKKPYQLTKFAQPRPLTEYEEFVVKEYADKVLAATEELK